MISFISGVLILVLGYFTYGRLVERIFDPDDRPTPAVDDPDGIDRVPLPHWKNMLIHLLNIAGIGPVIGVILGVKFGTIVFILLPLGNLIGGAVHDYFSGMISLRHGGANSPKLVRIYLGSRIHHAYSAFLALTLLLVGAVFVDIPANLLAGGHSRLFWPAVVVIFIYYFASTFLPIDRIIGRIYPVFGGVLLMASASALVGLVPHMGLIPEVPLRDPLSMLGRHPAGVPIIPMLFVTIACGIISGFHSCQSPIVARTMTSERQGRSLFFGMMICEGLIGMIWAAGGLALFSHRPELLASGDGTMLLRELVSWILNPAMAQITLLGVVVLAITSGDTALRSLRLAAAEYFKIDQKPIGRRLATTLPIFAAVTGLLIWSNADKNTFQILWNYFSWSNQIMAAFALLVTVVYLRRNRKPALVAVVPAVFMVFIVLDYILFVSPEAVKGAPFGFGLPPPIAAGIAAVLSLVIVALAWKGGSGGRAVPPVDPSQ